MANVYLYAVSYDLGFAPNPFGGVCSLSCCKPEIRRLAKLGDWVIGLTGTKLPPALRLVFAMKVTRVTDFDEYWAANEFAGRKAKRNGSQATQVGDNIYHRKDPAKPWRQEDSVHSLPGGRQCPLNTKHDTRVNRILLSDEFIYLGQAAPTVPAALFEPIGYVKNARNYRKFSDERAGELLGWVKGLVAGSPNQVVADPINFDDAAKNFSYRSKKMV